MRSDARIVAAKRVDTGPDWSASDMTTTT